VTSENEYGNSQLPKRKLPVRGSDDEFSDFSSGGLDNYIPDQAGDFISSKVRY
jgi:hypothetical protein